MEKKLTFGDVFNTNAYVSKINGNLVDDCIGADSNDVLINTEGKPSSFMRYNFVDNSIDPIHLDFESELKKLPDTFAHLGAYSVSDAFGKKQFIDLATTNAFSIEGLEAKVAGKKFFKFFIAYSDGETSYNAPSVISLDHPEENLELQILKSVSGDLSLTVEPEEQRYATTPNDMAAEIRSVEEIDFNQFNSFKSLFINHAY